MKNLTQSIKKGLARIPFKIHWLRLRFELLKLTDWDQYPLSMYNWSIGIPSSLQIGTASV